MTISQDQANTSILILPRSPRCVVCSVSRRAGNALWKRGRWPGCSGAWCWPWYDITRGPTAPRSRQTHVYGHDVQSTPGRRYYVHPDHGEELLCHTRSGVRCETPLCDASRSARHHLPLHRRLLQFTPPARTRPYLCRRCHTPTTSSTARPPKSMRHCLMRAAISVPGARCTTFLLRSTKCASAVRSTAIRCMWRPNYWQPNRLSCRAGTLPN